jgi:type IV conjugative transfer system protein TraL
MSYDRHVILNSVDSPLRILFWTKGQILLFIVPFFGGMLMDYLLVGCSLSVLNAWVCKQYKRRFGKGQYQAVLYWYFPPSSKLKAFPPSYIDTYLS